jgi:DNA mismatch repair protein MutL
MSRIYQLSPHVANQIAAGEVIERPASVVKELLENALDAGADEIQIDIRFGGLNQIKISDNGFGIFADDLSLAIAPHATSKLLEIHDLASLTSMGFRGEALASIAAVSRFTLHSRPQVQEHGMMLCADEDGVKIIPCPREKGTTVDVRDLFFNTIVRKSFLKTERLEYQAIEFIVKRFALSAPNIALTLTHNGKQTLNLVKVVCEKTHLARVRAILGKSFVDHALHIDCERLGMRLHGWISGVQDQRSQNDKQWVYLNQRMIKDKLIQHAIMQAYQAVLYPGRYPACLLYLTVPTNEVDINVHPTKHEVRFQAPRLVRDFVHANISEALISVTTAQVSPIVPAEPLHSKSTKLNCNVDFKFATAEINSISPPTLVLQNVVKIKSEKNHFWYKLNHRFIIGEFYDEVIYLFDVLKILQHQCLAKLQHQELPWPQRPLLVPVKIVTTANVYSSIKQSLELLLQLGFECKMEDNCAISVVSIPVELPEIDLHKFITQFPENAFTKDVLLQYCVAATDLDLVQFNYAEFIQYVKAAMLELSKWFVPLHEEHCDFLLQGLPNAT